MASEVFDIYVMVKETGAVIHATEEQWCRVKEVEAGRVWLYCFEEMKDQPSPDFDYDEPVLEVEKRDGRLQLTIREYSGRFHVDVFAFNRQIWQDVGGVERMHVGATAIVETPKVVVPPPPPPPVTPPPVPTPPPAPPEWEPVTTRLDKVIEKLQAVAKVSVQELQRKVPIDEFPSVFQEWTTYPIDLVVGKWVNVLGGGVPRRTYTLMGFMATTRSPHCQFRIYTDDPGVKPDEQDLLTWSIQRYYEMLGTGYYWPVCVPKYETVKQEYTLLVNLHAFMGDKLFTNSLYLRCLALDSFPTEALEGGCRKAVLWLKRLKSR